MDMRGLWGLIIYERGFSRQNLQIISKREIIIFTTSQRVNNWTHKKCNKYETIDTLPWVIIKNTEIKQI